MRSLIYLQSTITCIIAYTSSLESLSVPAAYSRRASPSTLGPVLRIFRLLIFLLFRKSPIRYLFVNLVCIDFIMFLNEHGHVFGICLPTVIVISNRFNYVF